MELLIAGLVLSTIAGCLSAVGFIPQTVKALITRSTAGISVLMALLGMIASIMWVIWGALNAAYANIADPKAITSGSTIALSPSLSAAQTAAPVWTNALVIIWTATLLFQKLANVTKAKNQGLTEVQYCNLKAKETYEKYKNSNSFIAKWITQLTKQSIRSKGDN